MSRFILSLALWSAAAPLAALGSSVVAPVAVRQPRSVPSVATKHLYVIEFDAVKAVLEFPVTNGIPFNAPDRIIRGLVGPRALTLDNRGNLYVFDGLVIKEFAPGASGHAKPIREIDLSSGENIDTLTVDAQGFVYVGQAHRVYAFSPTAHGHAKPVAIVTPVGYPAGLTIDAAGDLYALGNTEEQDPILTFQTHVSVYAMPASKPTRIREFCTHEFTDRGIDYGVAFDGLGRLLTTHPYFVGGSSPAGEVDVFNAAANACPVDPIAKITSISPSLLGPVYLAVDHRYLYVYDLDYGYGGIVFTLRTIGNPQQPLSLLYVAHGRPHNVEGIAIGP